jgi:hypothetical protein
VSEPFDYYRLALTCPRCGRPVKHESGGTTNGLETAVVVACTGCRDRWIIRVTATSCRNVRQADNEIRGRPRNCGSESGLQEHSRAGEEACEDCHAAHARQNADRKARSRAKVNA